jgi:hypothetical protein
MQVADATCTLFSHFAILVQHRRIVQLLFTVEATVYILAYPRQFTYYVEISRIYHVSLLDQAVDFLSYSFSCFTQYIYGIQTSQLSRIRRESHAIRFTLTLRLVNLTHII